MGRQRAPPEPCWRRLLRSGCRGLLALCGTALRGLRALWSLTWVGTAEPLPLGPPRSCAGSKRGVWPDRGRGRGAAGCNRCTAAAGAGVCCSWAGAGVLLGAIAALLGLGLGFAAAGQECCWVQSLHCWGWGLLGCCSWAGAGVLLGAIIAPLLLGLGFAAAGQECCWVQSLHCWGWGLLQLLGLLEGGGVLHHNSRLREWDPRPAAGSGLKALCRCAHQEPRGHGDTAAGTALRRAGVSRALPQVLLMCYKSCWDGAFQVTEELGTALQLRLEGSEEDVDSDSAWEPGQRAVGQQWRGDGSEAVLGRLEALEADVRFLCTELGAEKLLWSSRFLELLREQQSLRQRLQELPWQWNSADSPELLGEAEDQSASGSEGESPEARQWMESSRQPRGSIQPDRQKM
ncbi:uncharacterized protein LOC134561815 isoform X2 [Prinia subflava]|uniref:uncharacterized protein LOC134561815 isoform X2 n=1 Tax=Prinia subflava TaxID=208062 RepID=UPI002FE395B5